MRTTWLLVLTLAGCGSKESADSSNAADARAQDPLANLQTPDSGQDPARLQALIARAMPSALPDAKDAHYRNIRAGAGGSACGEVAAKGTSMFRPFVVTPQAMAVVGESAHIAYDDPSDFFADAWIRWCASPEELQNLAAQLERAAKTGGDGDNEVVASIPTPVPPSQAPTPPRLAAPSEQPPQARPHGPPPAADIDSFVKSVQRNSQ